MKTAAMACIQRITLYPIKSFDGVSVAQTRIAPGGSLEHDRAFAVVDAQGKFVNGKRFAEVHRLRAHFDLDTHTVTLAESGTSAPQRFRLDRDRERMEAWLSTFLGFSVTIRQDPRAGFPDDTDASGPTVISAATLAAVSAWFPGATPQDMQLRFRTNLEISGVPVFWEDRLFGEPGTLVDFNVGAVAFEGVNPCQRCVVPARHPRSGRASKKLWPRNANRPYPPGRPARGSITTTGSPSIPGSRPLKPARPSGSGMKSRSLEYAGRMMNWNSRVAIYRPISSIGTTSGDRTVGFRIPGGRLRVSSASSARPFSRSYRRASRCPCRNPRRYCIHAYQAPLPTAGSRVPCLSGFFVRSSLSSQGLLK